MFLLLDHNMVDRPLLAGYNGNLENRDNGNSNVSSNICPYILCPYYYSNDNSTSFNPSIIVTHRGTIPPLLSYFIETPTIFTVVADSASGDNATFGFNKKSGAISENEDFIPQAFGHADQN